MTMRRIVVVGNTGSGKTTLAGELAQRLALRHVELDALYWRPDWVAAPLEEFRTAVQKALKVDGWVVDGNYSKVRQVVWPQADTVVWLDYSLSRIMWQLWWRTWRRWAKRELLWGTNRERLWHQFLSRDSLFLWALQTYRRRRREYPRLLCQPQYHHLTLVRLRSPLQTRRWLERVAPLSR